MTSKQYGTILINTSNYDSTSNSYIYKLPSAVLFKGAKVSVQTMAVYNSTYNISEVYGNNMIVLKWLGVDYNVTIPDGFYSYSDLNSFVKQQCLINKLYCTTNNGLDYVFFYNLSANAVTYKFQLDIFSIPTAAQATTLNFVKPVGATWAFPATATTPQLQINDKLQKYFGIINQTLFPFSPQSSNQTFSTSPNGYPTVNPVFSYVVTCNLINTKLSQDPRVLTQITVDTSFGGLMKMQGSHDNAVDIEDGSYSFITIKLLDQNLGQLSRRDLDLVISLKVEF